MRWLVVAAWCVTAVRGQCETGWTYDGKGKCVKLGGVGSWGPDICEQLKSGSVLGSVEDQATQSALGAFIGTTGKVWTGLNTLVPLRTAWHWTDNFPYIWSNSNHAQLPNFNLWAPFKPTPSGGDCTYIGGTTCDYTTAYLCERSCTESMYSLCAYNPKTSPCLADWVANKQAFLCFKVTTTKQPFGDTPCSAMQPDASLASILTEEEADFIKANMALAEETWVGLTRQNPDPPKWEWADGTVASLYTGMWDTNRPNGAGACAYITGSAETECQPGTGTLCDGACSEQHTHLCEYDYQGPPMAPVEAPQAAPVPALTPAQQDAQSPAAKAETPAAQDAQSPAAKADTPTAQDAQSPAAKADTPAAQDAQSPAAKAAAPAALAVGPVAEGPEAKSLTLTVSYAVPDLSPDVPSTDVNAPRDTSDDDGNTLIILLVVIIALLVCCVAALLVFIKTKNRRLEQEHASINAEMEETLVSHPEHVGATPNVEHQYPPAGGLENAGGTLLGGDASRGLVMDDEAEMGTEIPAARGSHSTARGSGRFGSDAQGAAEVGVGVEGADESAWWLLPQYKDYVFKKGEMAKVRDRDDEWKVGAVVHAKGKGISSVVKVELSDGKTKVWHETQPAGSAVLVRDNDCDEYVCGTLATDYGVFHVRTTTGVHRWLDIIPDEGEGEEEEKEALVVESEYQYGQSVMVRDLGSEWQYGVVTGFEGVTPKVNASGLGDKVWDEVRPDDDESMGTEPDEYDESGADGRRAV